MVEALGSISARPPTPPRTSTRILSIDEKDRSEESPAVFQTPKDSPFANGSTGALSSQRSKRVNFSPWTRYIKPPPTFSYSALREKPELKVLPPSNECKPSKSILKTTNSPAPVSSPNVVPFTPDSFAMLLESVTQQLAGESLSSRLDAYMHLLGALKAYNGVPEPQEIAGKLNLITQFIQRDINRYLENGGPLDTNIVIHALKLSIALVWHPEISGQLPDDFKIFLVEQSINCLQEAKLPKSVLTHHMHILSTQNFNARIMNNARLTRLLTVLHDITSRVNGNAVVSQRLSIYQRILTQSKATFVSQSALWVEHLISGLLHHLKDTRLKAISLGFQTSMAFGPNPTLSRNVREIFDRPLGNGGKLVMEICERMSRMIASVDTGVHVPQIWSIIILLLRSKKSNANIDQWEHFKAWVLVLQKCFNCSESAIKAQAVAGWNRFVFVISPNETTSPSMLKMLSKPILQQFERKKQEKAGAQPSQLALSSYYNLLYYAFRPSASYQHLDVVWEEYVALPSSNIFASFAALSDRVSQALTSLLWSSQAKVWAEHRVNESNKLDAEELPSLDSRWVRSRIASVLKVFENIFKSSIWVDNAIEQSNIATAWISLSRALSFASSKEITPSTESMQAVAHVLGLLQRLWNTGPSSLNATGDHCMDRFFDRFRFLSTTIIFSIGSVPFTEKLLLKTADETFQPANTPTHRHREGASLGSPVLHFLRFISSVPGISEPTPSYLRLIDDTLEAACNGKVSRGLRLELLRQCAELYPSLSSAEFDLGIHNFAQLVWKATAKLAADCLRSLPLESARERDGTVSRDYENTVKILSSGLRFADVFQEWNQLLDSFVRVVRTEKGDWAIATMIIEPLAEQAVQLRGRDSYRPSTTLLNHSLSIPYYRQAGHSQESDQSASLNNDELLFPHKLVKLADKTLRESYEQFHPSETVGLADFIESLTSFLGSGVLTFRSTVLESLQQPLVLWVQDEVHQLNAERGVESRILTAYRALSSAVLNVLQTAIPHDTACLQRFESIIRSGLESSHMSIAKRFVDMWNNTFALQDIEYPEGVLRALQKLEPLIRLQRPGISSSIDSKDPGENPSSTEAVENSMAKISDKSPKKLTVEDTFDSTVGFNSSPVTRPHDLHTANQPGQSLESILRRPQVPLPQITGEATHVPEGSHQDEEIKHNDIFTMIEGLRSSSPPAPTPRELGFRTPPYLRHLNPEPGSGTPLTPTPTAISAENEDNFLGSSPTPGTRNHAGGSGSSTYQEIKSRLDPDPPSSPPEIKPKCTKKRKKSRSSALIRELRLLTEGTGSDNIGKPQNFASKENRDEEAADGGAAQDGSPQAELGSTAGRRSLRSGNVAGPALSDKATQKPTNTPKSGKRAKTSAKKSQPPDTSDNNETADGPDCIADSSSDDMEMQIASQLEQDMGLAVEMDETPDAEPSAELPHSFPMTRKRKRAVEDAVETPDKESRRASRLDPTPIQEQAAESVPEVRSTRSKRSLVSHSFDDLAPKLSPSQSTSKKRKTQPKSTEQRENPVPEGTAEQRSGSSKRAQKRRRRLLDRKGDIGQDIGPTDTRSDNQDAEIAEDHKPLDIESKTEDGADVAPPTQEEPSLQQVVQLGPGASEVPDSTVEMDVNGADRTTAPDDVQMQEADTATQQVSSPVEALQPMSRAVQTDNEKEAPIEAEVTETEILDSLRRILDDVKKVRLDRSGLKQIDDLLFDIRVETHEASRRHMG